jgi:integrase
MSLPVKSLARIDQRQPFIDDQPILRHFHDLRRSYASALINEGTGPEVIQKLNGHVYTSTLK